MLRVALVLLAVMFAGVARADIPPSYPLFGIGARLAEAQPFPKLEDVRAGSPAQAAGLKNGDAIVAIDGGYSAAGRVPFYFFARGMQGPRNSVVELVVLRDGQQVFTVKIKRTVALKGNW